MRTLTTFRQKFLDFFVIWNSKKYDKTVICILDRRQITKIVDKSCANGRQLTSKDVRFTQNRLLNFYRTFGKIKLVIEFFLGCWMQKFVLNYLSLLKWYGGKECSNLKQRYLKIILFWLLLLSYASKRNFCVVFVLFCPFKKKSLKML